MGMSDHRLVNVVLEEKTFVRRNPEVEHERAVASMTRLRITTFACSEGRDHSFTLRMEGVNA